MLPRSALAARDCICKLAFMKLCSCGQIAELRAKVEEKRADIKQVWIVCWFEGIFRPVNGVFGGTDGAKV